MPDQKIIAVVGSTGQQGGALCEAILNDPQGSFVCRAITRNPDQDKARILAKRGVEVIKADLDDVKSLENAFAGAYGAYCMTNFWEHLSAEREKAQARNAAEAARVADLQHVIWSTLEDTRKLMSPSDTRMPMFQGKYRVPHFDGKAEADAYFSGLPATYLVTTFYWDNIALAGRGPQKNDAGTYVWTLPMGNARLAGIAVEDIGKTAYAIYKAGPKYIDKTVGIAGEHLTLRDMTQKLSEALGVKVEYRDMDPDRYRALGFAGAEEAGNMFQLYRDFEAEIVGARGVDATRAINPELQTFDQWLARNKSKIPL
jgi:uncharacterized protein YbjT (DUF2867 family)